MPRISPSLLVGFNDRHYLRGEWRYGALSSRIHYEFVRAYLDAASSKPRLVDLGSGTGETIQRHLSQGPYDVVGVERVSSLARSARARFDVIISDLELGLGLSSSSVDVVSANQVIEHVVHVDVFVEECRRVLKPRGVAVISTENLAAWPNVAALALGFEPFSTNFSKRFYGVGNPLSRRQLKPIEPGYIPHNSVPSFAALRHLFELGGFSLEDKAGIHIAPLPNKALYGLRRWASRRSFYMTLCFRKDG